MGRTKTMRETTKSKMTQEREEEKESPLIRRTKNAFGVKQQNHSKFTSSACSDFESQAIDETPSNTVSNHRNSQRDHEMSVN